MIAQLEGYATAHRSNKKVDSLSRSNSDGSIGYCLNCGTRLTRCGRPFTSDVACRACGALNVFEESNQPVRFALALGIKITDTSLHDQDAVAHPERPSSGSE